MEEQVKKKIVFKKTAPNSAPKHKSHNLKPPMQVTKPVKVNTPVPVTQTENSKNHKDHNNNKDHNNRSYYRNRGYPAWWIDYYYPLDYPIVYTQPAIIKTNPSNDFNFNINPLLSLCSSGCLIIFILIIFFLVR